ncbi:CatA-like O-acetyltransferase, partial [Alcaligenes nematophilus]
MALLTVFFYTLAWMDSMEIQEKMMASYQKFDLESWGRREHFEVFKTYAQNAFSITVEIEITGFLNWVKARRCKFYPAMIHEVAA